MAFKRRKAIDVPEVFNDLAHLLHDKIIDGSISPAEMAVARNLIKDTGFFRTLEDTADEETEASREESAAALEAIRQKVVNIRSHSVEGGAATGS